MKLFKFFNKVYDHNIIIADTPMFRAYTHKKITQMDIDILEEAIKPYLFLPNTEETRNQMMNALSSYFYKIESIDNEDAHI